MEQVLAHGGWVAHLSYLLLVLSMLSRVTLWLRIGVIGSAITGIVYAVVFIGDPNLAFWEMLLLIVNLVQIVRIELGERRIRFDAAEDGLRSAMMTGLPRLHARRLIDQGYWASGEAGDELVQEREAVSHLYHLSSGRAEVLHEARLVGECGPGDLVGDATALNGSPATGTVRLAEPSHFWCIPAPRLRRYIETHGELAPILEQHINMALRGKLEAANRRLAS